jgi:SAM-dependent methyltransferase
MNTKLSAADWATTRGERWLVNLAGMEAMQSPIDEPLIAALRLDGPLRIADVACGGGGTSLEILRRAPAGSMVHGYDIAPSLVGHARGRVPDDETRLAFHCTDIATTAPASPYDRLASRFGVMFFSDPAAAFDNLRRWLAPGGRFAFVVWGPRADNAWMTTASEAVAEVVEIPRPDPEAPGPFRYAEADRLLALLRGGGYGDLAVRDWRGMLPVGGGLEADEAANFVIAAFSNFAELLAQAGDDARERARRSLAARFAAHRRDRIVVLPARVHVVTGVAR